MSDDYREDYYDDETEAPVWERPGQGDPYQSDPYRDDSYQNDPFTAQQRVEEVRAEQVTEGDIYDNLPVEPMGDPFNGGPGEPSFDQLHEYAYYYAKGNGMKEPSPRLVNMGATGGGFNFCAFFFGFIYLIYRKMYMEAGITLVLAEVAGFTLGRIVSTNVISLLFSMGFGLLFPMLYNRRIRQKVDEARARNLDVITTLRNAGGTNLAAALIVSAVIFGLTFMLTAKGYM